MNAPLTLPTAPYTPDDLLRLPDEGMAMSYRASDRGRPLPRRARPGGRSGIAQRPGRRHQSKGIEWLTAGAELVWVVYPTTKEIHAFKSDGSITIVQATDTLDAEPVIPEFRVPVADLFRFPQPPASASS